MSATTLRNLIKEITKKCDLSKGHPDAYSDTQYDKAIDLVEKLYVYIARKEKQS